MSFNNRELYFITDPCLGPTPGTPGTRHTFTFNRARGGAPLVRFEGDTFSEHIIQLADGSKRQYRTGNKPLRNVEIIIGRMDRYDVQLYRQWRAYGDIFALFPAYNGDTCVVTHFEDNLASEVGSIPQYLNAAGADVAASYVNGKIGRSLLFDYNAGSIRRLRYDHTLTQKGSIGFWHRMTDAPGTNVALFSSTMGGSEKFRLMVQATTVSFDVGVSGGSFAMTRPASGSWHHWAVDWCANVSSPGVAHVYFDGSLVFTKSDASFSLFQRYWYIGYEVALGNDCSASGFDEVRFDQSVQWDATEARANYDRGNEQDELALAENLQGHYFRVARDPFEPLALAHGARYLHGTMLCEGMWADPCQRVSGASAA